MPEPRSDPTGLVLIVVWREQERIVARLSTTPDLERVEEQVRYASSIEGVAEQVASFLDEFASG